MANGHILVVEDDADIATMLKIYFSGQGYDVLLASRGIDALNLALKQPPKLVILDIVTRFVVSYVAPLVPAIFLSFSSPNAMNAVIVSPA